MKNIWLMRALGMLLALCAALTLLASVLYLLPTNGALMLTMLERHSTAAASALPERDYPAMAEMISAYLRGETDEFQLCFEVGVEIFEAFDTREQQHMADVQGLFALCRGVMLMGAAATAALAALLLWRRSMAGLQGFRWGLVGVLLALTAAAVWAAVDFEGLFILFHEVAFSNDLWLLDPRMSMLIRLMPQEFFLNWAVLIGGAWLLGLVLLLVLCVLLGRGAKLKNGRDENP